MNIYHYDPETGVYRGPGQAEPDPLELELARDQVRGPAIDAARQAYDAEVSELSADDHASLSAAQGRFDAAVMAAEAAAAAVEPEHWLIPAHATTDAPPELAADQQAVMTSAGWIVAPITEIEPEPETEAPDAAARAIRDQLIAEVRWLIERHRDEIELGLPTTLTPAAHLTVLQYVQALREVPEQSGFPAAIEWPALPVALTTPEGNSSND